MSDPEWCFWCPFKGCQECRYKGSDDHARQGDSGDVGRWAKRDIRTDVWDNKTTLRSRTWRSGSTEGLTHSSDSTREGMAP